MLTYSPISIHACSPTYYFLKFEPIDIAVYILHVRMQPDQTLKIDEVIIYTSLSIEKSSITERIMSSKSSKMHSKK